MIRARVCKLDEAVEGVMRGFTVAGVVWPILVTRVEGEVIATSSICPHEDVSLLEGELADGIVTCPGHGYELELRTGRCLHDARLSLRRYRVSIIGDEIWIDLV